MRNQQHVEEEENEINLTPMLDVVFIMLIFFIVTASFIKEAGIDVRRPEAPTADRQDDASILIAISENDEVWIDRKEQDPRNLRATIERLYLENPKGSVVVQADQESTNETLVMVLEAAKQADKDIAKAIRLLERHTHIREVEHAVDRVAGVRTGCAVAASWRPDDADREWLVVLVEAAREEADVGPPDRDEGAEQLREDLGVVTRRRRRSEQLGLGLLPRDQHAVGTQWRGTEHQLVRPGGQLALVDQAPVVVVARAHGQEHVVHDQQHVLVPQERPQLRDRFLQGPRAQQLVCTQAEACRILEQLAHELGPRVLLLAVLSSAQVLINELDTDVPDTLELFNTGLAPVNIGGWRIENGATNPSLTWITETYILPGSANIAPGGFVLITVGSVTDAAEAVLDLSGAADAGFVRTGVLEHAIARGRVDAQGQREISYFVGATGELRHAGFDGSSRGRSGDAGCARQTAAQQAAER